MGWRLRFYRLGTRSTPTTIEPSCGIMDIINGSTIEQRVMTDCGLIPRFKAKKGEKRYHAPVPENSVLQDGRKIDVVRISHDHGDHFANLPAFSRYFAPHARIWMPRPSAIMAKPILEEAIKIAGKTNSPPPYDTFEFWDVLERIQVIERPGEQEIIPGFVDFVNGEGHINGACSFTTCIRGVNVLCSSDRCGHDQPGVLGAKLLPFPKWKPRVIASSDCTYGADRDSDRRTWAEEMDKGFDACMSAIKLGQPALWFTFALHRGGALAHEMARRGLTESGAVYLDGSVRNFTKLMMGEWGSWCELDQPLNLGGVVFVKSKAMREQILGSGGYAVIAPPGMGGPGGIGSWWRRDVLPNPDAVAVFTGYVAQGSDGAEIIAAAKRRDETGEEVSVTFEVEDPENPLLTTTETIPIRCKVVQIRTGSHDPRGKILSWFRGYRPEVAMLNHASEAALDSLEGDLRGDIPHLFRADRNPVIEIEL